MPSSSNHSKSDAKNAPLKLESILGTTSLSNASLSSSSNGDIYYAAGCCVVRYCPSENKQKMFYTVERPISCLDVSSDGKYLAVGERGHLPICTVFDINTGLVLVTLSGHKHGVGCIKFSNSSEYIATAGFKHDKQLILWQWRKQHKVCSSKLGNKVNGISFHISDKYFVTCGEKHLKWWSIIHNDAGTAIDLSGKPATILEIFAKASFTDVQFGYAEYSSHVYCTTSSGIVCLFNDTRTIDRWVQIESPVSYCLEIFDAPGTKGLLIVGCADGVVRAFAPDTLDYMVTLPLPHPISYVVDVPSFAACYAACKVYDAKQKMSPPKLATIYADRSIIVWDISDIFNALQYRSFLFHRACIWDVHFVPSLDNDDDDDGSVSPNASCNSCLPRGTFITCSADNSIRCWNINSKSQRSSKWKSTYSREMLHMIEIESGITNTTTVISRNSIANPSTSISSATFQSNNSDRQPTDLSFDVPDTELPDKHQVPSAPRSLAVHPYGHQIVCGDRNGKLRVYDLKSMTQVQSMQAHAAEVLTLHYSPPMLKDAETSLWGVDFDHLYDQHSESYKHPLILLASAGRDRLVHIFDASLKAYKPLTTLDNHSSSVTIAKFTSDGKRFLTCGGDRTMVFSSVNGPDVNRLRSIQTPHGTINGLAVEATNKFAITSGQDKRLNIWNVQTGKHMRAYKSDAITGELYKSDIDPSGMYVAACAFDKTINVFDFFSGELLTQVRGHSELVTGVRFSPDGQHLISIGGDGCIMVWKLSDVLVVAMQDRLMELYSNAKRKQNKALRKYREFANQTGTVVPPLAAAVAVGDTEEINRISVAENVWMARKVTDTEGYELFGHKHVTDDRKDRNKFTLELDQTTATATAAAMSKDDKTRTTQLAMTVEAGDDVITHGLSDNSDDDNSNDDDGDDDDDDRMFTKADNDVKEYASDFEDDDLDRAKDALDQLERSAVNIDSWIEDILRNDGRIDVSVSAAIYRDKVDYRINTDNDFTSDNPTDGAKTDYNRSPSAATTINNNISSVMNDKSLSSAFFHNHVIAAATATTTAGGSRRDVIGNPDEPPVPAPTASTASSSASDIDFYANRETKQRETATAVSLMRDRLRLMGILNTAGAIDQELVQRFRTKKERKDTPTSGNIVEDVSLLPPPPPTADEHTNAATAAAIDYGDDDDAGTSSTVTDDENSVQQQLDDEADVNSISISSNAAELEITSVIQHTGVGVTSAATASNDTTAVSTTIDDVSSISVRYQDVDLQRKVVECKNVLDELAKARKAALSTYEELLQMRESIDHHQQQHLSVLNTSNAKSTSSSHMDSNREDAIDPMMKSVQDEADYYLSELRQSLSVAAMGDVNGDVGGQYLNQLRGSSSIVKQPYSSVSPTRTIINKNSASNSIGNSIGNTATTIPSTVMINSTSGTASSSVLDINDVAISMLLEKYSDRLVDLISEKVSKKLKNDSK